MTLTSHPITIRNLRVARLDRAVKTLLDACRRGDVCPLLDELLALHAICVEQGAYEASAALRDYLGMLA